jgi:hypothetical protein
MSFYNAGGDTYKVPFSMHAENRGKLFARLAKDSNVPQNGFVLMQGGVL